MSKDPEKKPPNYAAAAAIIRTQIDKLKENASKIQGDLSAAWAKFEGYSVNKKAGKDILKILKMSNEGQQEYFRDFHALMGQFGLVLRVDLVDQAEGEEGQTVPFPTAAKEAGESALTH